MPLMPDLGDWSYEVPGTAAAGDVDVVRLYLQDTDPDVRLMSDIELQYLINVWVPKHDSLLYVAAVASEIIATKFAGIVTVSADGVSVNVSELSARYTTRAAALRQMSKDHQVGGEIDIANLMWDQFTDLGIKPLNFGVGMHDNRLAGRQEYGSQRGLNGWNDLIAGSGG